MNKQLLKSEKQTGSFHSLSEDVKRNKKFLYSFAKQEVYQMKPRYSFSSRRTRHTENINKQRGKYPMLILKIIRDSDKVVTV